MNKWEPHDAEEIEELHNDDYYYDFAFDEQELVYLS